MVPLDRRLLHVSDVFCAKTTPPFICVLKPTVKGFHVAASARVVPDATNIEARSVVNVIVTSVFSQKFLT